MANPTGKGGWRKGQSGNPAGRPHGPRALTNRLQQALEDNDGYAARWLIAGLIHMAMTKPEGQKIVWDRMEGKVALPIVGNEDAPIPVTLQFGDGPAKSPRDMTDEELETAQETLGDDDSA